MRPILAIVICAVLIGGLALYMQRRDVAAEVDEYQAASAKGAFALEITPSFSAEPDPFALDTGESAAVALRVLLNGVEVAARVNGVAGGEPIRIAPVPAMIVGVNEFFIEASPPLEEAGRAHALRIRVFRDDYTVADQTFWSEAGGRIAAAFTVEIPPARVAGRDDHGQ